jgi:DNA-binding NtrC family response regulator
MSSAFSHPTPDTREHTASKPTTVLFLGCPQAARGEAEKQLGALRVNVVWADSGPAALAELQRRDLPVLADFSRGAAILEPLRELRAKHPAMLLVAIVDHARPDFASDAVLAGAADVLTPPIDPRRLVRTLERERVYASFQLPSPQTDIDELYYLSPAMRELRSHIAAAALTRAGVLICGDRGTGRETVARTLHAAARSLRPGPFVSVDCGAHDGERLGVDLFGVAPRTEEHLPARGLERVSRTARLCEALGGTLYLRNLPEAPTRVQRRLARILRDREAVLAETGEVVALDVRCMVGADGHIDAALRDGSVQEELYRRISASRLDLPALRQRREDIPALANYFLRQACAAQKLPQKVFSRSALVLLAALPWSGNATELKMLMYTIVKGLTTRGIGVEDVLAHVRLDGGSVMIARGGTLRQARAQFEQQYIASILQQHRGRITQAAKALGIQRTNLYRKLRTLRGSSASEGR